MASCQDLATKQEVDRLETEVRSKIDESKEQQIIQAGGSIGASIALATFDPRFRALAARLAGFLGQLANLAAKVSAIFSLVASLASIAMVTLLQLRVAKLESQVAGLTNLANQAIQRANRAVEKADTALARSSKAITDASIASSKANEAIAKANTAINKSDIAILQSNTATNRANEAFAEARGIEAKSERAIETASQAVVESNQAKLRANTAIGSANAAIAKANLNSTNTNRLEQENKELKFRVATLEAKVRTLEKEDDKEEDLLGNDRLKDFVTKKELDTTLKNSYVNEDGLLVRKGNTKDNKKPIKDTITSLRGSEIKLTSSIDGLNTALRSGLEASNKLTNGDVKELRKGLNVSNKLVNDQIRNLYDQVDRVADNEKKTRRDLEDLVTTTVLKRGLSKRQVENIVDTKVDAGIRSLEDVNEQQYKDILDQLKGIPVITAGVVAGGLAPTLKPVRDGINRIIRQTNTPTLVDAATQGVCRTTQPGGCMQRNILDKFRGEASNLVNATGTAFSAANNALLLRVQGTVNTINQTTQATRGIANATLGVVTNAKHGLQAIQKFAETAWKATHADKIMQATATVMTIHNGMMLSNNLLSTVSEAANMSLEALGIRDSTDNPIDIGASVKGMFTSILTKLVGAENYAALTARIAKANRIYQTGINLLDTTYSLFDSARTVAELTAENTGQIGNALKEAGVVYENAYQDMVEQVNPQNASMRKLDKFRNGLEQAENVFSSINQVSSEVVEFKDNVGQLKTEKETLDKEVTEFLETKAEEKAEVKKESEVKAEIDELDFDRNEPSS